MKKKGFISIIALIIMSVLLSMVLYLGYISKLEYLILSRSNYKTQSYYQSEGKIYLALFDEEYYLNQLYLNILDVFRTNNFAITSKKIIINDEDLNFGDYIKDIGLKFIDEDKRINMDIIAQSNINGVETNLTSSGTIVNHLFESEYPILSPNLIDKSHEDDLRDLLRSIEENISIYNCYKQGHIYGMESRNFSEIILRKKDAKIFEISSTRDTMEHPSIENFNENEILIVAKKMANEELEFYIGDPDNDLGTIKLSGVIYVEGDIIISNDFEFKGIIIVRNGEIITNPTKKSRIYGMIITDNIENYEDFVEKNNIIPSRHTIYKYGTYLPGFLDPKLTIIKGK